jgi:hypothetical protein
MKIRLYGWLQQGSATAHTAGTRGGQNNGNNKKLRNRIYVRYTERTSAGNTE